MLPHADDLDVARDAHDLDIAAALGILKVKSPADRAFAGKELPRGLFADNGDLWRRRTVGGREVAAQQPWNAHRFKKLWPDRVVGDFHLFTLAGGIAGHGNAAAPVPEQKAHARQASCADPRSGVQPVEQLLIKMDFLRSFV